MPGPVPLEIVFTPDGKTHDYAVEADLVIVIQYASTTESLV